MKTKIKIKTKMKIKIKIKTRIEIKIEKKINKEEKNKIIKQNKNNTHLEVQVITWEELRVAICTESDLHSGYALDHNRVRNI